MKKIRLGRTNLEVSRVGIGGIPIQRPPEKQAIEIIKFYDSKLKLEDNK